MTMRPDLWPRVSALFDELLDVDRSAREGWIAERCSGDAELEAALRRMIAADTGAASDDFLGAPVATTDPALLAQLDIAEHSRFGPYRLLRLLGQGGMGEVHLAERVDGAFEQRVALKLVPHPTPGLIQRFKQERQILARMEHPNIARLFDGGIGEHGVPYFAMEYIEGAPISRYVSEHKLDVRSTLQLFLLVCDAVQYAHRNLVVHRDLKPSNIFVGSDGVPKLLDFGVAKALAETDLDPTRTATRVFTPDYAAPEQISGQPVTTATDVYSLGVVLYELLTGVKPYSLKRGDAQHAFDSVDVVAPSAQAASPALDSTRRRQLRGDIDRIVLTMMAREPERRYGSVEALANDIRRYLAGLPVLARGDGTLYRLRKFVRRNRVAIAATVIVALSLLAATAISLWQAQRANLQAERAEQQSKLARERATTAERVQNFMVDLFRAPDPGVAHGEVPRADELLARGARTIASELKNEPRIQSELYSVMARSYMGLGRFDVSDDMLGTAAALLADVPDSADLRLRIARTRAITSAELGRYDDALRAIGDAERALHDLGPGHDEIRVALADVRGWILRDLGHLQESEDIMKAVVADNLESLDAERSPLMNNLAYTLQLEGKADESIALYERVLAWRNAHFPPDDQESLWLQQTFAKSLRDLGYPERARAMLEALRPMLLKEVGPDHADLAALDIALGQSQMDLGDTVRGRDLVADAVRRSHAAAPMHNALWANAEAALADAEFAAGNAHAAREHDAAARAAWRALVGNENLSERCTCRLHKTPCMPPAT